MRSMRLLAVAVLAVVLALSSAQNVFASTEIAYDDSVPVTTIGMTYLAVRFTPSGQVRVVGARFYAQTINVPTTGYITGSDHTTVLLSFPVTFSSIGWNTITISNGPIVSGDFFIALAAGSVAIYYDAASSHRSYGSAVSLADLTVDPFEIGDLMIRALVDPVSGPVGPVGGFMEPVNKLAVFAPYLALFGMVAVVAVVVAAPWKKSDIN